MCPSSPHVRQFAPGRAWLTACFLAALAAGCAAPNAEPTETASQRTTVPSETRPPPTPTEADATLVPDDGNTDWMRIVATIAAASTPRLLEAVDSPDGTWRADFYAYDCAEVAPGESYAYQEARLVSNLDGSSHIIEPQLIACGGLGAYGLASRFWSPSSRFLYYTNAANGVPDGCGAWSPPLVRFDTSSMSSETLGPANLSPDGLLIAAWQNDVLGLWRLDGERLALIEFPTAGRIPGALAWRLDSSALAFLVSEGACPLGETELGRVDLDELRPIVVLKQRDPGFADLVWDAPNRVTLTDELGERWRFNFLTRDLWPIQP
jgi:hypothetical protein